jgi:hypothetical protein
MTFDVKIALSDLADFIDRVKNFTVALIFLGTGYFLIVNPNVPKEHAEFVGMWVGVAISIGSVYVGSRLEKSKLTK